MTENPQTKLLRIAAFLVDALTISILLILPASLLSYAMTFASSPKAIQLVWWFALLVLMVAMLFRDGFRGRSIGKQLLGLRLVTPKGDGCSWSRSFVRNLPLVVPVWNFLEVVLILMGRRRTGDRIAKTVVKEE